MRISGSTVLLTGATGGIGHAIARSLRSAGAELILTGRRTEVLAKLAGELDARVLAVDLSDASELDHLASEASPCDILIANAALPATGRLETFSEQEIDRALAVNLRAPIMLAHSLAPAMAARRSGHLLFMSSLSGKAATPESAIYNATKFGLRGFASALRQDLRESGVGVSAVFPGFIGEAGLFADARVNLPATVGTRSPDDVARAVIGAVERNRGEVDVAPLQMRAGAAFASLAPELAARVARRMGSERLASEIRHGQRDKR